MALVLKGPPAVEAALNNLQSQVQSASKKLGRQPTLCIVQIGNDPASSSYIRQKEKMAKTSQLQFQHLHLESTVTLEQLKQSLLKKANDPLIDGVMVQLPMDAPHLKNQETVHQILDLIPPSKDADGLHVLNQGRLYCGESRSDHWTSPLPCTALGVLRLLEHYKLPIKGQRVCVVGRSRLVGFPTAGLMTHAGATVTLCHRHTTDLATQTKNAQIIVMAAGVKHLLKPNMCSQDVVLVDVGIHRTDHGITGDIDPACYSLASAYSPVPGGVGPTTVGMLIENTLRLFLKSSSL